MKKVTMLKRSLFFGIALLFLSPGVGSAQESGKGELPRDTIIRADSLFTQPAEPAKIKTRRPWPDPKKAVIWSAVLPGAGQIYNKRWWKLPIVYGAYGALAYAIIFNNNQYDRLQTAYLLALDGEEHEFTGTSIDNPNALRTLRDRYDKNRQLSYIGLFFAYVLTGVDAFVDAHLRQFDIDDNISIRIEPDIGIQANQTRFGVGLTLTF